MTEYLAEGPNWIPVSERLPGTERILITDGEIVKEGYRRPDGVWKYGVGKDELFTRLSNKSVIAWMPLPEPYRPEQLREAGWKNHLLGRFGRCE